MITSSRIVSQSSNISEKSLQYHAITSHFFLLFGWGRSMVRRVILLSIDVNFPLKASHEVMFLYVLNDIAFIDDLCIREMPPRRPVLRVVGWQCLRLIIKKNQLINNLFYSIKNEIFLYM